MIFFFKNNNNNNNNNKFTFGLGLESSQFSSASSNFSGKITFPSVSKKIKKKKKINQKKKKKNN